MILRAAALALPLAGLALLLARRELDVHWEHHPAHFWLVLLVALVNVGLGLLTSEAARRRRDARVFLVSLAFLASAGFLGLHALATPGVLLEGKNAGFVIATPIGLLVAALLAAASALDLSPRAAEAIVRRQAVLRGAVGLVLAGWGAASLAAVPLLDDPLPPEEADGPLLALAVAGVVFYGFAAQRYFELHRRRPTGMLLAIVVALVLLAEAMVAVAFGRSWHFSWWEWHVLMAIAFGLVAAAARREYRRRESAAGLFAALYLDQTLARVREDQSAALRELTAGEPATDVRRRHRLDAEETELLTDAAAEIRRLDELFRPYLSPQLAARLREDPSLAELGGEEREVSVVFADLQGFTAFSEAKRPGDVFAMLNDYWASVVPVLEEHGGVIERFAGDAVMVVFNAAADQPDHARRAAAAGLALRRASEEIAARRPGWPRFRVGVNTGPAVVGNIGSREQRSFSAIGDTTNLAARLQTAAEPGQVVIGPATRVALGDDAVVEPVGPLQLKGKSKPVEAFALLDVAV